MARDTTRFTLRDLLRELAISTLIAIALYGGLLLLAALLAAMPAFIGLALRSLP